VAAALISWTQVAGHAATTPSWQQVFSEHYGPAVDFSGYSAVVSSGTGDAWALGGSDLSNGNGTVQEPTAVHWDGASWTDFAMPAGTTSDIVAASAPSSDDIWAVTAADGWVLHWDGTQWAVATQISPQSAGFGELTGVTAFSPTDVWVFGGPGASGGLGTWHYNGTAWQQSTTGTADGLERASALAANSIWAIGGVNSPDSTIMHYNGSKWQTIKSKVLSGLQFFGIEAFSNTDVYATATVGGTATSPSVLLHYNGKSWSEVTLPAGLSLSSTEIVSDGQGGLWLSAEDFSAATPQPYVVQYTSQGWSTTQVGANLSLASVPNTTSVLGGGFVADGSGGDAAVWAYGSF
jgi:hypothetical protein